MGDRNCYQKCFSWSISIKYIFHSVHCVMKKSNSECYNDGRKIIFKYKHTDLKACESKCERSLIIGKFIRNKKDAVSLENFSRRLCVMFSFPPATFFFKVNKYFLIIPKISLPFTLFFCVSFNHAIHAFKVKYCLDLSNHQSAYFFLLLRLFSNFRFQ